MAKTATALATAPIPQVGEPKLDWLQEQDCRGVRLPANVMLANAAGALMLGDSFSNLMSISGIVQRLTFHPAGYVRVEVKTGQGPRYMILFGSGMQLEVGMPTEQDKKKIGGYV